MIGDRVFRRTNRLLALGAAGLIALSACSGASSDSGAAEPAIGAGNDSAGRSESRDAQGLAGGEQKSGAPDVAKVDPAALQAQTEHMTRNAMLALQVKSIAEAAGRVRSISAAVDGLVLSENIGGGGDIVPLEDPSRVTATTYGEITISVPADRLDQALADLSKLGTVIRRETSSQNVHDQFVDTESRIKTMRASVDRVRALMSRATDISQIVTLESELSRRQADLEALESQLASLKDRIARSPVRISLTTDSGVIADDPGTGFLAGLKGGWNAFTASVVVLLTAVGAVLPFAVVAAAVAIPLWWFLRRRRAATPPPAPLPEQ